MIWTKFHQNCKYNENDDDDDAKIHIISANISTRRLQDLWTFCAELMQSQFPLELGKRFALLVHFAVVLNRLGLSKTYTVNSV